MSKNKMSVQAELNKTKLCPKFTNLNRLCPTELMLISQIIPHMLQTERFPALTKGQCVLVPTDLKIIQIILSRSSGEKHLISLALKRRLTDKSVVNKQQLYPALVNSAL